MKPTPKHCRPLKTGKPSVPLMITLPKRRNRQMPFAGKLSKQWKLNWLSLKLNRQFASRKLTGL
ncbi:hypothetical protein D3C85_1779140 [compost metagenome]